MWLVMPLTQLNAVKMCLLTPPKRSKWKQFNGIIECNRISELIVAWAHFNNQRSRGRHRIRDEMLDSFRVT